MQPSHSHKKTYLQTQLTDPSKPAPFDHAKQMNAMSQKRWNKTDKQKDVVAYQTQLYKTNVQLHGPRHFNAAIEQHAGTPSSIIAKAHETQRYSDAQTETGQTDTDERDTVSVQSSK